MEGRSLESVRRILEQLHAEAASVQLADVLCSLGPARGVKAAREVIEIPTDDARQMMLLEARKTLRVHHGGEY